MCDLRDITDGIGDFIGDVVGFVEDVVDVVVDVVEDVVGWLIPVSYTHLTLPTIVGV